MQRFEGLMISELLAREAYLVDGGGGRVEYAQSDARDVMLAWYCWVVVVVIYVGGGELELVVVMVESGRRDGAAVATAVYAAAMVVVVGVGGGRQSGRRWDGRGKGVAWTSRRLGKVGYRSHRRRVLLLWQHRCRC